MGLQQSFKCASTRLTREVFEVNYREIIGVMKLKDFVLRLIQWSYMLKNRYFRDI